jgi:hypothetical protein
MKGPLELDSLLIPTSHFITDNRKSSNQRVLALICIKLDRTTCLEPKRCIYGYKLIRDGSPCLHRSKLQSNGRSI